MQALKLINVLLKLLLLSQTMRQKQGFQPKLGCLTASCYPFFIIKNLIVPIQYVALLNTQKSFDTVWSHCLMYKFHCLEVSGRLWSLIDDCHTNTSCSCCSKLNKLLLVPYFTRSSSRWNHVNFSLPFFH